MANSRVGVRISTDRTLRLRSFLMQFLPNGDGEGGGFSGRSARNPGKVAAFDQMRNGLRLDRRRLGVAFLLKGFQNGLDEPQVVQNVIRSMGMRR